MREEIRCVITCHFSALMRTENLFDIPHNCSRSIQGIDLMRDKYKQDEKLNT